MKYDSLLTNS